MKHLGKFFVVVLALAVMHGCGTEEPSINDVRIVDVTPQKVGLDGSLLGGGCVRLGVFNLCDVYLGV